jgi:flagellar biosynthetic protein FliR
MDLAALQGSFDKYLLVLVRVTGFFGATPFFGSRSIPASAKIGLSLVIAYFLLPVAAITDPTLSSASLGRYAQGVISELVVGFTLGYIVTLTFSAIQIAGQLIDVPIGFSMVNVLDPQSGQQMPVMGQFQYILVTLLFLAINGHHQLIYGLSRSFQLVPLGGWRYFPELWQLMTGAVGQAFALGFRISLPVVAALLLTDIALGVVARSVPQMNVFIVGLPLKIGLGVIFMMIILPMYVSFVNAAFGPKAEMYSVMYKVLGGGVAVGR